MPVATTDKFVLSRGPLLGACVATGRLVQAEAAYRAVGAASAAASTLLGVLLCQSQRASEAAPLLSSAPTTDWVAHEYLGGVYFLLARRLTALGRDVDATVAQQRTAALQSTTQHLQIALAGRDNAEGVSTNDVRRRRKSSVSDSSKTARGVDVSGAASGGDSRGGRSSSRTAVPSMALDSYPQRAFAQDRAVVYRALGDALEWLGRHKDAAQVYQRGYDEGVWPFSPMCRPVMPLHDSCLLLHGQQRLDPWA